MDYRTDPTKLTINPAALKVSGNTATDLIMDGDRQGTDTYLYGDTGNIYLRDTNESWSVLGTAANSQGNGMRYFGEDSYLYYTSNTVIGRYGPFGGTKSFVDDFLGSEGGVPLNTHSLTLDGTADYATAADSASLSITGNISLESYVKFASLPASGSSSTFISKWNENGNQRSYIFEILGVSNYFGDGGDGVETVSVDDVYDSGFNTPLVDAAATATADTYTISATNASFAADQKILIHQTRGSGAGQWERHEIQSYTAGTITTKSKVVNTYVSGAQVMKLNEFSSFTVDAGKTLTAKAWDGSTGGIIAFLCSGTIAINGTITADEKGFRGGAAVGQQSTGKQGEGTSDAGGTQSTAANGNGGGGGQGSTGDASTATIGGGGSGGNANAGTTGGSFRSGIGGAGGSATSSTDLTTLTFGGGGGSGGTGDNSSSSAGANGGGIIFVSGATITMGGSAVITADGGNSTSSGTGSGAASGAGGGGAILFKAQTATLGTTLITGTGGSGASNNGWADGADSGAGSTGVIHIDYLTSTTGTTTPTITETQDNTLTGDPSYQLRLGISTNGTAEEYLAWTLDASPATGQWIRYAVTWDASASTAKFYQGGSLLGQNIGSATSIKDSTALLAIGASFNAAGAAENFLDAQVDDNRIFNDIRTANELLTYSDTELASATANLQAYYQHDNALTDSSANANTLTLVSAPPYTTDVPFSAVSSRNDLDQSLDTSGQTETLPTSIDEGATNRQSFVPAKDPQKSIEVNINTIGTGDWTMTVHDSLNREVASVTVVNGDLNTGDYEFIFSSVWRPVIGATYHFHITSTVANGVVVTTDLNDLETCDFHTYYQFLVSDANHPIEQVLNKLAIGNERYLATWDGITWNPHKLTLPSGYKIRTLGIWRGYLMIGCSRGTNISDYDQGMIFIWDGTHTTYNDYIPVKEGAVNSIVSGDTMYFMAGYSGDLMEYNGGSPRKIRRMPKVLPSDSLELNRNAMTMYKGLVRIGMAENSTSTEIEKGVYSYGSLDREVQETLSFDYPLSLGITQDANIDIGMLMPIGANLLISWRNGSAYGVDLVTPSNSPYTSASIEFLITDVDKIEAEKQVMFIRSYFKKLASGDTVKLKYKIDRESAWQEGTTNNQLGYAQTANDMEARLPLPEKGNRFNEFQFGIDLTTSNSTSPEIYGIAAEFDDLNRENRV